MIWRAERAVVTMGSQAPDSAAGLCREALCSVAVGLP